MLVFFCSLIAVGGDSFCVVGTRVVDFDGMPKVPLSIGCHYKPYLYGLYWTASPRADVWFLLHLVITLVVLLCLSLVIFLLIMTLTCQLGRIPMWVKKTLLIVMLCFPFFELIPIPVDQHVEHEFCRNVKPSTEDLYTDVTIGHWWYRPGWVFTHLTGEGERYGPPYCEVLDDDKFLFAQPWQPYYQNPDVGSSLNGSHGEYTGSDDLDEASRKRRRKEMETNVHRSGGGEKVKVVSGPPEQQTGKYCYSFAAGQCVRAAAGKPCKFKHELPASWPREGPLPPPLPAPPEDPDVEKRAKQEAADLDRHDGRVYIFYRDFYVDFYTKIVLSGLIILLSIQIYRWSRGSVWWWLVRHSTPFELYWQRVGRVWAFPLILLVCLWLLLSGWDPFEIYRHRDVTYEEQIHLLKLVGHEFSRYDPISRLGYTHYRVVVYSQVILDYLRKNHYGSGPYKGAYSTLQFSARGFTEFYPDQIIDDTVAYFCNCCERALVKSQLQQNGRVIPVT